jgi:hypothetical protein
MKKILIISAIISIAFTSCKKDDDTTTSGGSTASFTVEKKNRAAVIYFGEDWCPPCGTYGGPTLDSCLLKEGTLLTGFKMNGSSNEPSLNSSIANAAYTAFNSGVFGGAGTIPAMALNNQKISITTSITYNTNAAIQKATTFSNDSVIAGIALRKSIVGDSIAIDSKVKFFKDIAAGSDYTLGLYVVEDHLIASQQISTSSGSAIDANYEYRNLVRTSNGATYTGVSINSSAAITADQEFESSTKIYLKPAWNKSKLKVVGVIWKKGTTPATVINSNVVL